MVDWLLFLLFFITRREWVIKERVVICVNLTMYFKDIQYIGKVRTELKLEIIDNDYYWWSRVQLSSSLLSIFLSTYTFLSLLPPLSLFLLLVFMFSLSLLITSFLLCFYICHLFRPCILSLSLSFFTFSILLSLFLSVLLFLSSSLSHLMSFSLSLSLFLSLSLSLSLLSLSFPLSLFLPLSLSLSFFLSPFLSTYLFIQILSKIEGRYIQFKKLLSKHALSLLLSLYLFLSFSLFLSLSLSLLISLSLSLSLSISLSLSLSLSLSPHPLLSFSYSPVSNLHVCTHARSPVNIRGISTQTDWWTNVVAKQRFRHQEQMTNNPSLFCSKNIALR